MDIRIDYAQLPAGPSLWQISRIPSPAVEEITNPNNLGEELGPLKTVDFHIYACTYLLFSWVSAAAKSLQSCPTLCDPKTAARQAPRPWLVSNSPSCLLPLLASLKVICSCRVPVSFFLRTSISLISLPYVESPQKGISFHSQSNGEPLKDFERLVLKEHVWFLHRDCSRARKEVQRPDRSLLP